MFAPRKQSFTHFDLFILKHRVMDAAQELVKVVFESDKHFKIPFLSTYSNIVVCNQSHVMNVKQGVKIKTVFQFLTWTVIKKTMCI